MAGVLLGEMEKLYLLRPFSQPKVLGKGELRISQCDVSCILHHSYGIVSSDVHVTVDAVMTFCNTVRILR